MNAELLREPRFERETCSPLGTAFQTIGDVGRWQKIHGEPGFTSGSSASTACPTPNSELPKTAAAESELQAYSSEAEFFEEDLSVAGTPETAEILDGDLSIEEAPGAEAVAFEEDADRTSPIVSMATNQSLWEKKA